MLRYPCPGCTLAREERNRKSSVFSHIVFPSISPPYDSKKGIKNLSSHKHTAEQYSVKEKFYLFTLILSHDTISSLGGYSFTGVTFGLGQVEAAGELLSPQIYPAVSAVKYYG